MTTITVPRETWDAMREAHRKLIRAYVNLLESGRDRIVSLGGICDPVDQMEASDPALREAKDALTAANAVSAEPCTHCGAIHAKGMNTLCDDGEPQAQGEAITLQRWGRAENLCLRLLDPMDDGYWTPWHIAQEAIDSLQKQPAHPQATEPQAVASGITLAQLVQAISERDLPPEVTQKIVEQIAGLALSDPATEQFLRRLLAGSQANPPEART